MAKTKKPTTNDQVPDLQRNAIEEEAEPVEELPSENLPAVEAPRAVTTRSADEGLAQQLERLGASPGLVRKAVKAAKNFELMETPRIPSIKAGSNGLILNPGDEDAPEEKETTGVILYAEKNKSFYERAYTKGSNERPDCYSLNGRVPEADSPKRQNDVCKTCKQNQFGTAREGKGKACRDLRKLFLLGSVKAGEETIMPKQLTLTPTSIKNLDNYLADLTSYGYSLDEVETRIQARKKDREDKFVVLSFQKAKSYSEDVAEEKQVLANVQALKTLWLPVMRKTDIVDAVDDAAEEAAPNHRAADSTEF